MAGVVLSTLSVHVVLAWLGFSLIGTAALAAIPGIVMIKRRE